MDKEIESALRKEGYDRVYTGKEPSREEDSSHQHSFDTKLIILDGSVEIEKENEKIILKKGDSIEIPRGVVHSARAGEEGYSYIAAERH